MGLMVGETHHQPPYIQTITAIPKKPKLNRIGAKARWRALPAEKVNIEYVFCWDSFCVFSNELPKDPAHRSADGASGLFALERPGAHLARREQPNPFPAIASHKKCVTFCRVFLCSERRRGQRLGNRYRPFDLTQFDYPQHIFTAVNEH